MKHNPKPRELVPWDSPLYKQSLTLTDELKHST